MKKIHRGANDNHLSTTENPEVFWTSYWMKETKFWLAYVSTKSWKIAIIMEGKIYTLRLIKWKKIFGLEQTDEL